MDDNRSPYTPRSKSLDLLRAEVATPVTTRNSLDTISTLRGLRISGPIFLNSSIGVKPLPEESRLDGTPSTNVLDEEDSHTFGSSSLSTSLGGRPGETEATPLSASTMSGYLSTTIQPRTPSRRQMSPNQLRSKFSMSPVQRTKRSKARMSEDHTSSGRLPQGFVSQDNARSTLGNWSHSLGMAARKLHKSAGKSSEESYQTMTLSVYHDIHEKPTVVTPDKTKNSLRSATSLASIRKYITPSRRIRKVSVSRGLMGSSQPRALLTVDDVGVETFAGSKGNKETGWVDTDSRAGLSQKQTRVKEQLKKSFYESQQTAPTVAESSSQRMEGPPQGKGKPVHLRAALSPGFYDAPQQPAPQPFVLSTDRMNSNPSCPVTLSKPVIAGQEGGEDLAAEKTSVSSVQKDPTPAPTTSKLKQLQLLARRPFHMLGRKMREMEGVWWPSRRSHDGAEATGPVLETEQDGGKALANRHSDDVLTTSSPRVSHRSSMVQTSRSVELDRIQLDSKIIPLRPAGGNAHKRRPTIPEAFAKPLPESPPGVQQSRTQSQAGHISQPRISDLRHPWMKQLKLGAAAPFSTESCKPQAREMGSRQNRQKMVVDQPSMAKPFPAVSLTAAGLTMAQPITASLVPVSPKRHSPRRPPASLLGQSLPIPPRRGRSRASTISTQSSTTSSPLGKVIVSRRSYGQRLNSPSTREETGSIRSVGTSILFTESPPGSPGLRKLMSPYYGTRSPSLMRVRSPPTAVLLPKFSPRRATMSSKLQRRSSTAYTHDSDLIEEQEWLDEGPIDGSSTVHNKLETLRSRLEEVIPPRRPGFLETTEATHTLSELVKTFSGSSGSLSLNASPFKKNDINEMVRSPRGLYGIMEADEPIVSSSPIHLGTRRVRERLISTVSLISTEANSSFEDSEELQKLLESIMAADLGNASSDTSGSRNLALLSPFGSPAEYRGSRTISETVDSQDIRVNATPAPSHASPLPPPPKFLLNDRPISPPDSTCMSESTQSGEVAPWDYTSTVSSLRGEAAASRPQAHTHSRGQARDDAGVYASFSDLDVSHAQ